MKMESGTGVARGFPVISPLVSHPVREEGSAIVFCARQKTTEELAAFLKEAGLASAHFHGGMKAEEKCAVQEAYITSRHTDH
ncbi:MAG: hypothetical protein LBO79_07240 [Zoogloeaceae bacterium]|jgi:ATP-dependent DNA helicase RecQ|nr:hypothetical protein [Zoogloeaceae bacterium]